MTETNIINEVERLDEKVVKVIALRDKDLPDMHIKLVHQQNFMVNMFNYFIKKVDKIMDFERKRALWYVLS